MDRMSGRFSVIRRTEIKFDISYSKIARIMKGVLKMYPTTRHRRPNLKTQTSLFDSRRQPLKRRVGLLTLAGIDMFIKGQFLFIEVRLPGFSKDEVEVSATSESLEISALKKTHPLNYRSRRYLLHESLQSFWRHLTLPPGAKWEELNYIVRNDKLIITMPVVTNEFQQNEQSDNNHHHATDYSTKESAPVLIKNQEYADHWSRYRPPRQTSWL